MATNRHKKGLPRNQMLLLPPSLDELVPPTSPARIVDAFVENLDLAELGFFSTETSDTGAPPYHPADLLKLYLYGYLTRVRSSRQLERQCQVNVEAMWLMQGLRPKHRTIAYFRAHHPKALRNTFRHLILLCRNLGLLDTELVAIDGSKFRAVNSKKNNFNQDKLAKHIAYIDRKLDEYLAQLDDADRKEHGTRTTPGEHKVKKALEQLRQRKQKYEGLQQQLEQSGDTQVSTTDPDSRHLVIKGQITEIAYNLQTATEAKNKLVVHYEATNEIDRNALHAQALAAKEAIGADELTVLADKGYSNAQQFHACDEDDITTLVAPQEPPKHQAVPAADYRIDKFVYRPKADTYTCPQGHTLATNGTWYDKDRKGHSYHVKRYKTKACATCPVNHLCTANAKGRVIERSEYQQAADDTAQRTRDNMDLYRTRQHINEHVFGTIKRAWGYTHTLLKGKRKVDGEFGLVFTAYNLRRLMSILAPDELNEAFRALKTGGFGPFCRYLVRAWAYTRYMGSRSAPVAIEVPGTRLVLRFAGIGYF